MLSVVRPSFEVVKEGRDFKLRVRLQEVLFLSQQQVVTLIRRIYNDNQKTA